MEKRYRKRRQRRIGIALLVASAIAAIALVIAFCSRCGGEAPADPAVEAMAPAQTQPVAAAAAQPVAAGTAQSAAAPATPTPAPTPTPVPTLRPWSQPCVAEYDYQYEDATRYIHIDRVEENGTTCFVADVQLQSASQFGTWFAGDTYGWRDEPLSSMARKAGAVFAVNADNYNAHEYGVIIRDGVLLIWNVKPHLMPAGNPETGYMDVDGSPTKTDILEMKRRGTENRFWELSFGLRPEYELYDLVADPYCMNNLAEHPEMAATRRELTAALEEQLTRQGDPRMGADGDCFDTYRFDSDDKWNFYERVVSGELREPWETTKWINPTDYEIHPENLRQQERR